MKTTKQFIVVTSIQSPTPAIRVLAALPEWQLIVVGDRKTPRDWQCEDVVFLDVDEQARLGFKTCAHLPFGHYARKNLGYLYAIRAGATLIYETDDDNHLINGRVPVSPRLQKVPVISSPDQFVNVYRYYTDRPVWPRGFPLDLIRAVPPPAQMDSPVSVPVQQGLANNDPDVDAIYRLVLGELFDFERTGRYALGPRDLCPFNSQATLWHPEAFWALLLPAAVPMRVTDIWRGYIAQILLARFGHTVLFTEPTMRQDRNVHNLIGDFRDEMMLYTDVRRLVEVVHGVVGGDPLSVLAKAYEALATAGLLGVADRALAAAWIYDLNALQ